MTNMIQLNRPAFVPVRFRYPGPLGDEVWHPADDGNWSTGSLLLNYAVDSAYDYASACLMNSLGPVRHSNNNGTDSQSESDRLRLTTDPVRFRLRIRQPGNWITASFGIINASVADSDAARAAMFAVEIPLFRIRNKRVPCDGVMRLTHMRSAYSAETDNTENPSRDYANWARIIGAAVAHHEATGRAGFSLLLNARSFEPGMLRDDVKNTGSPVTCAVPPWMACDGSDDYDAADDDAAGIWSFDGNDDGIDDGNAAILHVVEPEPGKFMLAPWD